MEWSARNFIIAEANLDLVEVPPSKAHKIYEALVTSLRYQDTDLRGLYSLIKKALEHPAVIKPVYRHLAA